MIYVGTGESQLREDLTYGTGVYRSTDGGETLAAPRTRRHAADHRRSRPPGNPDLAYVAAMGHAFGPNAERGVFRTIDGGKSWKKILFLDDSTGANDLAIDPTNPRILFACMWKFQRTPWGMDAGGGRSGLWKSTDGGDTWTEISFNPGMPKTPLGKIGVDVSPANPRRVYATIEAPDSSGGIFRSDDGGDTWTRTNGDQMFRCARGITRPSPRIRRREHRLRDEPECGSRWTAARPSRRLRVPHGDTHIMWVDPKDPERMINGNDGGGTISFDGGKSWSTIDNQPTAQFYHVITDNQWPYRIYGAQQDNSAISIASRSDDGVDRRARLLVRGRLRERPHRRGPAQSERHLRRLLHRHAHPARRPHAADARRLHLAQQLRRLRGRRRALSLPVDVPGHALAARPDELYAASQYVWRSTTEGRSWENISPDLTCTIPRRWDRRAGRSTRT